MQNIGMGLVHRSPVVPPGEHVGSKEAGGGTGGSILALLPGVLSGFSQQGD